MLEVDFKGHDAFNKGSKEEGRIKRKGLCGF